MKTHKFTASVVMPCNREQFEELRPELEKIGYSMSVSLHDSVKFIGINFREITGIYWNSMGHSYRAKNSTHKLKEYNKALFLDLARCTDDQEGIEGERYMCIKPYGLYVEGFLYEFGDQFIIQDEEMFRKATPEEIIEWHYSKKERFSDAVIDAIVLNYSSYQNRHIEKLYEFKPKYKGCICEGDYDDEQKPLDWWSLEQDKTTEIGSLYQYDLNKILQPVEEKKKYTIVFNSSDDLVLIDNDTEEDISFTEPQRDAIEWFLNTFADNPKTDFKKALQSFKMHVLECADRGEASKSIEEFFNM